MASNSQCQGQSYKEIAVSLLTMHPRGSISVTIEGVYRLFLFFTESTHRVQTSAKVVIKFS